jgi:hypothetical protein
MAESPPCGHEIDELLHGGVRCIPGGKAMLGAAGDQKAGFEQATNPRSCSKAADPPP